MDCSLACTTLTEHLKMMRLLFLCLLLLLPAAASKEIEGSSDDDQDDEDYVQRKSIPNVSDSNSGKTTGVDEASDQVTLIVIVVAVTVLTLSVAAIVAVMLVRRQMQNRQQGIYSVPTEQDQKRAI